MTITICHNKPPDRKWSRSMDDVMPGRDGPENLSILKLRSWDWTIEAIVEYSAVGSWILTVERWSWVFGSLPTEILNTTRYASRWGWGQHSNNCVSLLVSPWTEVKKLINRSYLKQQSPPVFAYICICICICTVVINIMIMGIQYHIPKSTIRLFSVINGTLVGGVSLICRGAVGVLYSPSRLGNLSYTIDWWKKKSKTIQGHQSVLYVQLSKIDQ